MVILRVNRPTFNYFILLNPILSQWFNDIATANCPVQTVFVDVRYL